MAEVREAQGQEVAGRRGGEMTEWLVRLYAAAGEASFCFEVRIWEDTREQALAEATADLIRTIPHAELTSTAPTVSEYEEGE